jgi:hypothetical protein
MAIFDDTDLQGFADLFEDLGMKDDCQIKRSTTVDTDYGKKEELVVIAECKGVRKKPGTRLIQLYADRLGDLTAWEVEVPLGQDVLEGDIVTMSGDNMEVQVLLKETWHVSTAFLATEVQ